MQMNEKYICVKDFANSHITFSKDMIYILYRDGAHLGHNNPYFIGNNDKFLGMSDDKKLNSLNIEDCNFVLFSTFREERINKILND